MAGEFGHWPKTSPPACCNGSAAELLAAGGGGARPVADDNADAAELLAAGGGGARPVADDDTDAAELRLMRTIDIAAVLHRKEAHEEKTEDHYHGHAGEVFPELARTFIATDRFVLLSRPSSTHKINK